MKNLLKQYIKSYAGLPKQAWLLAVVVFVNRCGTMVIFYMTLYLTRELGFDLLTAGRVVSIYGVGSLIGSYFGGWLADKWGTRKVQFYSLIGAGIGYILVSFVHSLISVTILLALLAIVGDAFRPANGAAFAEVCDKDNKARGFALLRLAANLGIAIGPAVGGMLALVNYKLIFWADGLTCLAAAALFQILFRETKKTQVDVNTSDNGNLSRSPWRDSFFLYLMGLLLIIGVSFFQLFGTWPLYLKEQLGFFENQIGLLLTINAILIVLIEMPLVHKVEKKDPLKMIAYGTIFLFSGFALLPLSPSYYYIVLTVMFWSIGEILIFPIMATMIANRADEKHIGRYMGVFTLTFSMSMVVAPMTGTFVYDRFGPDFLWTSFAGIGVLVLIGLMLMHILLRQKIKPA